MRKRRGINEKLYRDSVHGIVALDRNRRRDRVLMALLDTREMQRLRRIRQLGLAYMVYQGAEHSRFTHVLGVMHLMGRVLRQLAKGYKIEREDIFLGQVAALLHDVGHGPFSHVFERFTEKHHEDWSREIILSPASEVHSVLSDYSVELPARVVSVLHERKHRPRVLTDLIASQLDVDRFDYLVRDGLMTGVKHGVFDLDRLIAMLRINPRSERLVVAEKGIYPLEKYLQARFYMYRQVYQHKTVVAAEAMLTAVMRRMQQLLAERGGGRDALPPGLRGLTLPPLVLRLLGGEREIALEEYLQLDEAMMWYTVGELQRAPDPVLRDLARRLLARRLFKSVIREPEDARNDRLGDVRDFLRKNGLDPEYYLLEIKSTGVGYAPYHLRSRHQKNIEIEMGDGTYREAAEVSDIIRALTDLKYETIQYCYPAETPDGKSLRRQIEEILGPSG